MSESIIVPALGESITEATISRWIKNQGEQVNMDMHYQNQQLW